MLGSLAALATLATVGEVSHQAVSARFVSGHDVMNFCVCLLMTGHMKKQYFMREL